MRLLVVTTRFPTPDRPAAGAFIRERLDDPTLTVTVLSPSGYRGSRWVRFLRLVWDALTVRGPFDGVETHFVLPAGPIGLMAARLRRLPLVVVAHGSDVRVLAQRSALHRWLARRVLGSASAVVANSRDTAAHVRRLGFDAKLIPPGIDLSRYQPSPRPAERRVLYLGGDSALKGIDVARRFADTLVGPGLDEVDPADVPSLIAAHDVVLVPSREEAFGLAAAEAIASGRWVVASAVGGLVDVVSEGVNGTLVSDGRFETAVASVPDYDPVAVAATAGRFSISHYRDDMRRVWEGVLASRSGAASAPGRPAG